LSKVHHALYSYLVSRPVDDLTNQDKLDSHILYTHFLIKKSVVKIFKSVKIMFLSNFDISYYILLRELIDACHTKVYIYYPSVISSLYIKKYKK